MERLGACPRSRRPRCARSRWRRRRAWPRPVASPPPRAPAAPGPPEHQPQVGYKHVDILPAATAVRLLRLCQLHLRRMCVFNNGTAASAARPPVPACFPARRLPQQRSEAVCHFPAYTCGATRPLQVAHPQSASCPRSAPMQQLMLHGNPTIKRRNTPGQCPPLHPAR